jgi:hypothetical protein
VRRAAKRKTLFVIKNKKGRHNCDKVDGNSGTWNGVRWRTLMNTRTTAVEVQMLPATTERVSVHTSDAINRKIRREAEERVSYFATHPAEIPARLHELDREWDIERTLETNASSLALTGVVLGATLNKRWLALPALVLTFLFQHAVQGWCPPVPILRRLGYRTASEIDEEKYALKALRGDFAKVGEPGSSAAAAMEAART